MEIEKKMLKSIDFNGMLTYVDTVNRMQETIGIGLSTQLDIIRQKLDEMDDDLYISEIFESNRVDKKQYKYVKVEPIKNIYDNQNDGMEIIVETNGIGKDMTMKIILRAISFVGSIIILSTSLVNKEVAEIENSTAIIENEKMDKEREKEKLKVIREFIRNCKKKK